MIPSDRDERPPRPDRSRRTRRVVSWIDVREDLEAVMADAAVAPVRIVHAEGPDVWMLSADAFERVFSAHLRAQETAEGERRQAGDGDA